MFDLLSQNEGQNTSVLEIGNLDISFEVTLYFEAFA